MVAMLLVDAANVIGSRPTGWWRDRPGAARTFHGKIVAAVADGRLDPPVVVVLEGQSRRGVDEGTDGGDDGDVEVVHAAGEGDDTLVDVAAASDGPVLLVTADRELARRVREVGADVVGPSWLWNRLDASADASG